MTKRQYLSYLIRIWLMEDEVEPVWRASAEEPGTRKRWGFATLADLLRFLEEQTRSLEEEERRC